MVTLKGWDSIMSYKFEIESNKTNYTFEELPKGFFTYQFNPQSKKVLMLKVSNNLYYEVNQHMSSAAPGFRCLPDVVLLPVPPGKLTIIIE